MFQKLFATVMVLLCASMTFGQTAQSRIQSYVGSTKAAIGQAKTQATSTVTQATQQMRTQAGQIYNQTTRTTPQAINPVNNVINNRPIATTTPHDQSTAAQSIPQNYQEFHYQPQPQQYSQPVNYNYNTNSNSGFFNQNFSQRQFQPVRRAWNFTRSFVPFGR